MFNGPFLSTGSDLSVFLDFHVRNVNRISCYRTGYLSYRILCYYYYYFVVVIVIITMETIDYVIIDHSYHNHCIHYSCYQWYRVSIHDPSAGR